MSQNKVFVIGIDGASIDLVRTWIKQGKLPHLKHLIANGSSGRLKTVPNMNSAPAWTSIYTGQNPGNHGIHFFYEKKVNSYEVRYLNGSDCKEPPVWSILSQANKSVGVINVPMTYPARPVNGYMISGFDAPGLRPNAVFPPSLMEELNTNIPDYFIELGLATYARQGNYDVLIAKALESIKIRTKAAIHFMDFCESDFFMMVYRETDIIQHSFWKFDEEWYQNARPEMAQKYQGTILMIYQAIDTEIGKLLAKIDDQTTVMVVSDHGSGPFDNIGDLLGDFLVELGYMKLIKPGIAGFAKHYLKKMVRTSANLVDKYLSRRFKEQLVRLLPELRNTTSQFQIFGPIDWSRTKVYGTTRPELWINQAGREPLGTVAKGKEYDELIVKLKDDFQRWLDPATGKKVILDVQTRDEVYHGKNLELAPDIILTYNPQVNPSGIALQRDDGSVELVKLLDPNARIDSFLCGAHSDNGIIIIKGPQIKSGYEIHGAEVTDVTPTILALALNADFSRDGKILTSVIKNEAQKNYKVAKMQYSKDGDLHGYSEDDAKIMKDRLKDLGYI